MTEQKGMALPYREVTTIVLAGGKGTRIRHLHPDLPKPLVPVLGRPFLHWLTCYLARFGLRDFVYSTGHLSGKIEDWVKGAEIAGLNLRICRETEPLGTGGGVLNCLATCGEWVLVVNGDSVCTDGVERLLSMASSEHLSGGLLGLQVPDTSRYGSLSFDGAEILTGFREKVPGAGYINGGVYLFRTEVLRGLGDVRAMSMEQELIPSLLEAGHALQVIRVGESPFIDIGTPETLEQAEAFVRAHLGYLA